MATDTPTTTPPDVDYIARIPLTAHQTEYVIRFFADSKLADDARAQVNAAIAAIVEMAVEEDRARRGHAPDISLLEPIAPPPAGPPCPACKGEGLTLLSLPHVCPRWVACNDCGGTGLAGGVTFAPDPDGDDLAGPLAPPASWASRVARALMEELGDDRAVKLVAQAIANQVLSGNLECVRFVEEITGEAGPLVVPLPSAR